VLGLLAPLAALTAPAPPAGAQTTCGWHTQYQGTTGAWGFTPAVGVRGMPGAQVVRTSGLNATASAAVDVAIATINHLAGSSWSRGPSFALPSGVSPSDAYRALPAGEIWILDGRFYPNMPPGSWSVAYPGTPDPFAQPRYRSALIKLSAGLATFPAASISRVVHHELGHAAGLDHHFARWDGLCQLMAYADATTFRAGDHNGLRWLAGNGFLGDNQPVTALDQVRLVPGALAVSGWAVDRNAPLSAMAVHLYRNGHWLGAVRTGEYRPDVTAAWRPRKVSVFTGYQSLFALPPPGFHQVCAWGINLGAGSNQLGGCRTVVMPHGPIGSLDGVSTGTGAVRVWGWAIDHHTAQPIGVSVVVAGTVTQRIAEVARHDVAAAHPWFGPLHGYDVTVPVPAGTHLVCVGARNVGPGADQLLGCRMVTVP
jgi:hypothetical protein